MASKHIIVWMGVAALATLALLLAGCAGTAPPREAAGTAEASAAPAAEPAGQAEPAEQSFAITEEYDLKSLLQPLIQLSLFRESADYFGQFVWDDDWIFPDYLFKVFWLDYGPYREGQGTILASWTPQGELDHRLSRSLVEVLPDGSRWWQVSQEVRGQELFYEVLVSALDIQEAIRYVHPETGEHHEYISILAEEAEQALEVMSAEELRARIQEDTGQELVWYSRSLFNDPQILGEETIEVEAGRFPAVHVQDTLGDEGKYRVDYWLSPAVPGGILKMVYSNPAYGEQWVTELSELTLGNTRQLLEVRTAGAGGSVPGGQAQSEGSPGQPVEVFIGEPHYGAVGPEGTSYYALTVDRQSDISIEVSDFAGDAELYYYAEDPTFENWVTASQGSSMNVEDYLVPAGTTVYFSVVDYSDEYGEGESYTIAVSQSFVLDRTGIMMRGNIYEEARALESGRSYTESLERDGLNYYKVVVKAGGTLNIQATGLSDDAALSWFDTEGGSYGSASSSWDENGQRLEIDGLEPGTVCYFYISGDTERIGAQERFHLTVAEQ